MLKESEHAIPYIRLGDTIELDFGNHTPTTCEITDYLLGVDGTLKYRNTITDVDIEILNGRGSFVLDENWAVSLSSQFRDYETGATLRGFKIICNWKDRTQEYALVARTDAFKR
ncbi:hypothetical protein JCM10914A_05200 [Paenibacillus sp. JCM 10914]